MLQTYPVRDLQQVAARLHDEFSALSHRCVERCVSDSWKCAEHLGYQVTPSLVEGLAREHLQAVINSEPPSRLAVALPAQPHEGLV
ncbi:hypothetical protein CDO52_10285 [Nocardiopsis gilva YIM 90087]|uniref:Uncharacterized protein n=1 Tax=Nocardiopsis gilva YIM 90087 TaxID=1235441 RepID=A0A223S4S9_9ACTN|nr:hypothetical protein [Nocardiopsis gilva]ASU83118.1 hypothetical protein CDO52_10285 [Nocardiopsis gilva YIM 90087]